MGRCPSARLYLAELGGYFYGSLNVGTGTDDKGVQLVSSGEFGALIGFGAQQSYSEYTATEFFMLAR